MQELGAYSNSVRVSLPYKPPTQDFVCGQADTVKSTNRVPKAMLFEGEMLTYGQFPIQLTKISGGNGEFKGEGLMRVPYFNNARVRVTFESILVNELNQIYAGRVVSVFNPHSKFMVDDLGDYIPHNYQIGHIVDAKDSSIDKQEDDNILISFKENIIVNNLEKDEEIQITETELNTEFTVAKSGDSDTDSNETRLPTKNTHTATTSKESRKKDVEKKLFPTKVIFEELSFPDFTFDANEKDKCINYPTYKNKNYIDEGAPWVSVFENTPIQVSANVVPSSTVGKISIESDINAIIKNNSSNPALIQLQSTHPLNYFVLAKDTINKNEIIGGLNVISQSVSNKKNHIVYNTPHC